MNQAYDRRGPVVAVVVVVVVVVGGIPVVAVAGRGRPPGSQVIVRLEDESF